MSAYTGRDVVLEFAPGLETASPASLTFKRLGMMRSKSLSTTWDTADTTADQSPDYTKTSLVTFKSVELSGDGVTYDDDAFNQAEFAGLVISPGAGTNYQPKIWFRITTPTQIITGPFMVPEYSEEMPHDDSITWSMTAQSNGAITRTEV
jgi:predicted secreted protein